MPRKGLNIKDGKWTLYVLKCEKGRRYIGVTKNVKRRFDQHKSGEGAMFTKVYKPLAICNRQNLGSMSYAEAEKYEDAYTLEAKMGFGDLAVGGRFFRHMKPSTIRKEYSKIDDKYKNIVEHHMQKPPKKKKKKKPQLVQNYSSGIKFTAPKLNKKTGTDGIRSLIKRV